MATTETTDKGTTETTTEETNGNTRAKGKSGQSKPFEKLEEAQGLKPESEHAKLFEVIGPDGRKWFVWAGGRHQALFIVAKEAGWSCSEQGKAPSKEKVATMLGQLSPEDRKAL